MKIKNLHFRIKLWYNNCVANFNSLKGGSSMSSNIFFEQTGRKMFGQQFGYAIEYFETVENGIKYIRFAGQLILPEDPQNAKRPLPIDMVTECLFRIVEQEKQANAIIYGKKVSFGEKETMYEIKKKIRDMQKSLIKIDETVQFDIQNYLNNNILELIRNMPVQ